MQRIFSEYGAGRSLSDIARGLHRDKVPTKTGAIWRQSTVSGIVRNPVYLGKITYRKEALPGNHKPIIDQGLWDRAAELIAATPQKRGRPPKQKRHIFTGGFLRCAACGESMLPRSRPDGYEFYECNGRKIQGCTTGAIRRRNIDEGVLAHFEQVGLDLDATRESVIAAIDRRASEVTALYEAAEQESKEAEVLARVKRDYMCGELTAAEWREFKAELEPEALAAAAEAERLRGAVGLGQSGRSLGRRGSRGPAAARRGSSRSRWRCCLGGWG